MSIVDQLSSKTGDRTELSNIKAAVQCLENPTFLSTIARTLSDTDDKLAADCTEVMTKVAEENPLLAAAYAGELLKLLQHKHTKVRWEAVHALSLITEYAKEEIKQVLPRVLKIIVSDKSTIARDYAVDIAANYAKCGQGEAETAFPILKEALYVWEGKHAAHALNGLIHAAEYLNGHRDELLQIGVDFGSNSRGVVVKAAKKLMNAAVGRQVF
jgi:hypothetical protein